MTRIFVVLAGLLGFTAVALGAFGAHGLRSRMEALPDGVKRLEWWNTAAHYHLTHALALAFVAWLAHRGAGASATVAGWSFVAGVALFSGSLYVMTITGQTRLGAITPLGGLFFLVGWGAVMVAGWRLSAH
ncbi:MAG: DUF423 domain-containing protein [Deltaproteobacteria bacterium]|nr:DUF423 domain-containing protein [Deltaproteobacteria bacterium]MBW1874015.1 DUF423 domain-containing protein [Deltaproteobacteria bacterium]MBW2210196.1 DUF423 domain-containing protein [Deltaproteobacteria bacterium]MBW2213424.1 DUF423 domain-containing protein [Deltaproteobacteria bacterium]MBW2379207.1 DUF423 domain-containing protein [Deltaproteobacteria bacterium]